MSNVKGNKILRKMLITTWTKIIFDDKLWNNVSARKIGLQLPIAAIKLILHYYRREAYRLYVDIVQWCWKTFSCRPPRRQNRFGRNLANGWHNRSANIQSRGIFGRTAPEVPPTGASERLWEPLFLSCIPRSHNIWEDVRHVISSNVLVFRWRQIIRGVDVSAVVVLQQFEKKSSLEPQWTKQVQSALLTVRLYIRKINFCPFVTTKGINTKYNIAARKHQDSLNVQGPVLFLNVKLIHTVSSSFTSLCPDCAQP